MIARRFVAGLLVAVALIAASLAWWGLTLQRTIFDSGRSTQLSRALLDSGQVQDSLVNAATKAVEAALPATVRAQVSTADISSAARSALKDPAVTASLERALVGTHRYLIGDSPTPPTLDSAPLDAALRRQLIAVRPDLASVVPSIPPVQVKLPDAGVPAVHDLRRQIARLTAWTAAGAVAGIAGAFVLAKSRRAVLRRVGFWALTTGGLWVALRYVLPAVVRAVVPSSAALVGGLAEAMAEGMAVPGLLLAGGGLAALVASVLPSGVLPAGARAPASGVERKPPQWARDRSSFSPATPSSGSLGLPAPSVRSPQQHPPLPPADAPAPQTALPGLDEPVGPRWVPGLGYVVEDAPPEGGRWVEGVGYVLD